MKCLQCRHENPATVVYCQRCGKKLDMTADEIRDSIMEGVAGERAAGTEENMRNTLAFGVLLFVLGVSLFIAVGSVPEGRVYVPSAAESGDYVKINWRFEPKMDRALVPFKVKGRNP